MSDDELAKRLRDQRTAIGGVPGSLEVWMLLRSLRTLSLRLERHCTSATALARWLNSSLGDTTHSLHGLIRRVWHPSLPNHPGHVAALRSWPLAEKGWFGGTMALELHSQAAAQALPGALRLFKDATSLGGVESLVEWRRKYDTAISPYLLRLSVGLEDAADLQNDLEAAILGGSALKDAPP